MPSQSIARYVYELDDSLPAAQRIAPWNGRRLEREYVWAADPGAYVDECVAQLVYVNAHQWDAAANSGAGAEIGNDTTPRVLYVLTDCNATVRGGRVSADGRGGSPGRPVQLRALRRADRCEVYL